MYTLSDSLYRFAFISIILSSGLRGAATMSCKTEIMFREVIAFHGSRMLQINAPSSVCSMIPDCMKRGDKKMFGYSSAISHPIFPPPNTVGFTILSDAKALGSSQTLGQLCRQSLQKGIPWCYLIAVWHLQTRRTGIITYHECYDALSVFETMLNGSVPAGETCIEAMTQKLLQAYEKTLNEAKRNVALWQTIDEKEMRLESHVPLHQDCSIALDLSIHNRYYSKFPLKPERISSARLPRPLMPEKIDVRARHGDRLGLLMQFALTGNKDALRALALDYYTFRNPEVRFNLNFSLTWLNRYLQEVPDDSFVKDALDIVVEERIKAIEKEKRPRI